MSGDLVITPRFKEYVKLLKTPKGRILRVLGAWFPLAKDGSTPLPKEDGLFYSFWEDVKGFIHPGHKS